MAKLKLKVCGLKNIRQMQELIDMDIDYIGINFYTKSPRYYTGSALRSIYGSKCKKVGVFVNEEIETVKLLISNHGLDYVQLHGEEDVDYVNEMATHANVIKVYHHENLDQMQADQDKMTCDYTLIDTASPAYGGSGIKFDWQILDNKEHKKPFFIAGGIALEDSNKILKLKHKAFAGVDINSKFELEPGVKDLSKIKLFLENINQATRE